MNNDMYYFTLGLVTGMILGVLLLFMGAALYTLWTRWRKR